MNDIFHELSACVVSGDVATIRRLTDRALAEGMPANEILQTGLMPGMDLVGRRFKNGELFVPEVLLAAKTMQASMDILRPSLTGTGAKAAGRVVLGTVKGDMHNIGKNLVGIMLRGAGFEVIDLGIDVPAERFVAAVNAERPDIVGMSALLTTTLLTMAETVKALRRSGAGERVRIMVGGAPITQQFADEIGADGYGSNAGAAVDLAKRFMGISVPARSLP